MRIRRDKTVSQSGPLSQEHLETLLLTQELGLDSPNLIFGIPVAEKFRVTVRALKSKMKKAPVGTGAFFYR
jgi:hypothetical protein